MKLPFFLYMASLVAFCGCSQGYDQLFVDTQQKQTITSYCEQADKALDTDLEKAQQLASTALQLADKESYTKGQGDAHYLLGQVQYYQGEYGKAMQHHFKGLEYRETIGDKKGIVRSCNNLASIYRLVELYKESGEYFEKGLEVAIQTDDTEEQAKIKRNLGRLFQAQKDYDKAEAYYEESLALYTQLDSKKYMGYVHNDLAMIQEFKPQPDYEKILAYHQKTLQLNEQGAFLEGMGWSLLNIGRMQVQLNRPQEALASLQKAEALLQKDYPNLVNTHLFQAKAYRLLGKQADLRKALSKAESLEPNVKGSRKENLQAVYQLGQEVYGSTSSFQWKVYKEKEKNLLATLDLIKEKGKNEQLEQLEKVRKVEVAHKDAIIAQHKARIRLLYGVLIGAIVGLAVLGYFSRTWFLDQKALREVWINRYPSLSQFK